eukprot:4073646-Prymnesium_polylepis.1
MRGGEAPGNRRRRRACGRHRGVRVTGVSSGSACARVACRGAVAACGRGVDCDSVITGEPRTCSDLDVDQDGREIND